MKAGTVIAEDDETKRMTIKLLTVGTTYKWFVKACNTNGCAKFVERTCTVQ